MVEAIDHAEESGLQNINIHTAMHTTTVTKRRTITTRRTSTWRVTRSGWWRTMTSYMTEMFHRPARKLTTTSWWRRLGTTDLILLLQANVPVQAKTTTFNTGAYELFECILSISSIVKLYKGETTWVSHSRSVLASPAAYPLFLPVNLSIGIVILTTFPNGENMVMTSSSR